MFYVFLLIIAIISIGVYVLFIFRSVPGAAEQRLGVLEPLPPDLGKWLVDEESPEAAEANKQGLKREVRHIFTEGHGLLGQGKLVRQVRYRNRDSGAIEHVEPEQTIKRRRVKKDQFEA